MKMFLIATTALALIASPASAQLLGGGGALGGGLGGALGSPMGSVGSVSRGTLDAAGSTSGSPDRFAPCHTRQTARLCGAQTRDLRRQGAAQHGPAGP